MLSSLLACTQAVEWNTLQRQASLPAGDLYADHTVGQTFRCQHDGLNAVEIRWSVYDEESGRPDAPIELVLYRGLQAQEEVVRRSIAPDLIVNNATFRLSFPEEADSAGRSYLLLAAAPEAETPARATLWAHGVDLYPQGALLRDGDPAAGDLTFSTFYQRHGDDVAAAMGRQGAAGLRHLPALLLLLLAPGYLLARWLPPTRDRDLLDLLGICLGLSLAAVPLAMLLLSLLPLRLSPLGLRWGGAIVGLAALGALLWDLLRGRWRGIAPPLPVLIAAAGIVGVGIFLRALHVLDLAGPPWVDAVHHTLLARLIVERGAIPTDYRPYVDVAPATYHFGFQSLVAALHGMTGMPLERALLVLGQTLSSLVGLTLYPLGKRWGRSRWAGLAAALVPTALLWIPSYLTSWSRYTQLAGLLLLPLAVYLIDRLLRPAAWRGGTLVAASVTLAGLLVTHLRVAAFAALLGGLALLQATARRRYQPRTMIVPWGRILAAALLAVALAWPWLWPSVRHLWLPAAGTWPPTADALSLTYLLLGAGRFVWPVVLLGTGLALLRRRWQALLLAVWVGLLVLLANPRLLGISIGSVVDNLSVDISLYLPLGLGAALTAGEAVDLLARTGPRFRPWLRWAGVLLLVALSVWGARHTLQVINTRTVLLAEADLVAMEWIDEQISPDAVFLVNAYEWLSPVYAGTDGGYWIAPLTGRQTWPPPALYGLGASDYILGINEVVQRAMDAADSEALHDILQDNGITHVYLGRYGGPLWPEKLNQPWFRLVYQRDGVSIYERAP